MSLMDWDKNVDPHYKQHYFRPPLLAAQDDRHVEKWITYGKEAFGAKELTARAGVTVTVSDGAAYGCILVQGQGQLGGLAAEAAGDAQFSMSLFNSELVQLRAGLRLGKALGLLRRPA